MSHDHLRKLNVDGYSIVIVERVDFTPVMNDDYLWCVGAKRPIALLCHQQDKTIALGMDGESLDPLEFPEALRAIALK